MTADGSTMSRRAMAALAVGVVIVGACARSETLGVEEAVEVMVLDGVGRDRATCIVYALDGELDLDKITGLETDLNDDELALLGGVASDCSPAYGGGGGVVGGEGLASAFDPIAALADPQNQDPGADVDALIDGLVLGGMDPHIGACLVDHILADQDPGAIVASDDHLASLILECRRADEP